MTLYRCTIAPLDQSSTGLGWSPGLYVRSEVTASGDSGWADPGLQFLADPGTPVVAPFPVTVVSTSPLILRPTVDLGFPFGRTYDIKVLDLTPAAAPGTALDKGGLIGRIAPTKRRTRWVLWGTDPVFGRGGEQEGIDAMFGRLGLEPVGIAPPSPFPSGFSRVPGFGGRLLARSTGPAGAGCAPAGAIHGLGFAGLGSAAPAGYVDPQQSVYARYGASSQTDTSVPRPEHQNVSSARAAAGGGALLAAAAAAGLVWWASKG